ncbi:ChaN family lipoprotein [Magnetospirillum sp. SS-4]|uniref:ChaN family lipoprotein n=1 Tax=Magnetospirillum sp. SS-4 TaxID=2681465 RepID=UPI0013847155|nr:ChaN family lipoprotein [Magnetospirillum sp. SS-4]CAA7621380.1 conserved exported hypothetical protein [Magnetospirillum sp. SS-4]
MTLIRLAALAALTFTIAAHAAEPPPAAMPADGGHPLAGHIWHPASGRMLSPDEVVAHALETNAVLLGETHDNPDHHALQAWMVRRLSQAGRRPAVVFEMIDLDQQPVLDALGGGDTARLGEALNWEKRGWPAWTLYRPIAEAAAAAGGRLGAANLPAALTRQIAKGQHGPETAARFGLDQPPPPDVAAALAEDIRAGHCGMLPEPAVPGMVRVQRARDAAMAEAMATIAASPILGPVVLIAGSGHVRTDYGVPARLRRLIPDLRPFSLAFVEVEPEQTEPTAYDPLPFDAVWFTEGIARDDSCERMRRHMEKKDGR